MVVILARMTSASERAMSGLSRAWLYDTRASTSLFDENARSPASMNERTEAPEVLAGRGVVALGAAATGDGEVPLGLSTFTGAGLSVFVDADPKSPPPGLPWLSTTGLSAGVVGGGGAMLLGGGTVGLVEIFASALLGPVDPLGSSRMIP